MMVEIWQLDLRYKEKIKGTGSLSLPVEDDYVFDSPASKETDGLSLPIEADYVFDSSVPLDGTGCLSLSIDGDRIYCLSSSVKWREDEIRSELEGFAKDGMTGIISFDLGGGEFIQFTLSDGKVKETTGEVVFNDALGLLLAIGPMKVSEEDITLSLKTRLSLSDEQIEFLLSRLDDLSCSVANTVMEDYFLDVLEDEARELLEEMEEV